jgi:hypothetical protein
VYTGMVAGTYRDAEGAGDEAAEDRRGRACIAVIGIDRYRDPGWQRLHNAVGDARGVLALFARLGFEQVGPLVLDELATGEAISCSQRTERCSPSASAASASRRATISPTSPVRVASRRRSAAPATQRLEPRAQLGLELVLGSEHEQVAVVARLAAEHEGEASRGGALSLGGTGIAGLRRAELCEQRGDLLDDLGLERRPGARAGPAAARQSGRQAALVADELAEWVAAAGHVGFGYTTRSAIAGDATLTLHSLHTPHRSGWLASRPSA